MNENVQIGKAEVPILFSLSPDEFWQRLRMIVREEMAGVEINKSSAIMYETPGLIEKPLYKIAEVCKLFQVTKPTIYDWIKHGKLKPLKVRSRVYFLMNDIKQLFQQ